MAHKSKKQQILSLKIQNRIAMNLGKHRSIMLAMVVGDSNDD